MERSEERLGIDRAKRMAGAAAMKQESGWREEASRAKGNKKTRGWQQHDYCDDKTTMERPNHVL